MNAADCTCSRFPADSGPLTRVALMFIYSAAIGDVAAVNNRFVAPPSQDEPLTVAEQVTGWVSPRERLTEEQVVVTWCRDRNGVL